MIWKLYSRVTFAKRGEEWQGRKPLLKVKSVDRRLIGELTGLTTQTTNILLTDPLGSVVATFSNTAGSAALSGNQAYGPYGHLRYNAGGLSGMGTSKGFSGQYADAFSGLDYYDSRYYQPAVGVFLSADSKEGNTMGMDPYMYVGGNPQTYNDPSGQYFGPPSPGNGNPPPTCVQLNDCWSGSGGSGHPPTSGNNPPPTGHSNPKIVLGISGNTSTKLKGPTQSQIQKAQLIAAIAAAKFVAEGAALLALAAALPQVVAALGVIASDLDIAAGVAVAALNWIAAPILFALSLAATALATYVAKSVVTLIIGGTASLILGAIFAGRAVDDNAHDWTSAALNEFGAQVQDFTLAVRLATGVASFISGNGIVSKLIGATVNVSAATYALGGLDTDLAQMRAAVGA